MALLPEFGFYFLLLGLFFSAIQSGFGLPLFFKKKQREIIQVVYRAGWFSNVFLIISFIILILSFIQDDFSVRYVAEHSYSALPWFYKLTAVWGGHEGSLLLWVFIFSIMSLFFISKNNFQENVKIYAMGCLGLIHFSFLLFIVSSSNPFVRTFPGVPKEGLDLNPLLQDPLFVIHPPLLYTGYVAFAFVFAMVLSLFLDENQEKSSWSIIRSWSLIAAFGLTLGIIMGSFWAYYELGWGGWWYWDPVENSAFMPWLLSIALIHSVKASIKRETLQHWTAILGLAGFLLSLLGTFLVRSGVLVSVHAFASDPQRGLFILILLSFFVILASVLYFNRSFVLREAPVEELWSREFSFRLLNGLLVSSAALVFIGTVYPLILEVFDLSKISVGPPYFNQMILPLFIPLLILMGFGPSLTWIKSCNRQSIKALFPGFVLALLFCGLSFIFSDVRWTFFLGIAMVVWIVWSLFPHFQRRKWQPAWGMVCGHLGIAALVLGITVVTHFEKEKDVGLNLGEQVKLGPYLFKLEKMEAKKGPNYQALQAQVDVFDLHQQFLKSLFPERRIYAAQKMPMSETALDGNLVRDLYVALSEQREDGSFAMRFYYKPMVRWIWLGGLLISFGLLMSFRKRKSV